jgi:hypothetical protein
MKNFITLILFFLLIFSCAQNTNPIKNGTFELYENDELIGKIYRLNNFQIETYENVDDHIARIDYKTDSTYLIRGIEKVQVGVDSIVFLNKYKMIKKNEFQITAEPYNVNLDYKYKAVLKKISDDVDEKYSDTLKYLNRNYKIIEEK